MYSLEVLQTCPTQRKSLLSAIGVVDLADSSLITFDLENQFLHLPQQISFLIQVIIKGKTIHQTVIDEGASTYIMSISCWKAIGSPPINQSPNTLEAFYGIGSHPYGILTNLPIMLKGKPVELEVEVVDANPNYNLLLRLSWTHTMFCVVSSLFRVLHFPHEGKIVKVDQLSFFSSGTLNDNVPYVGNTKIPYESVGVSIFKGSSLVGNFTLPPPNVTSINMILGSIDPWIIPTPYQIDSFGDSMSLSPLE